MKGVRASLGMCAAVGSPPAQPLLPLPLFSPPQAILISLLLLFSHSFPQLIELLTDLNEPQVQFASKVVCKATVIVMEAKVGRADFTDTQFLLLKTGCRHGISVFFLEKENRVMKVRYIELPPNSQPQHRNI